MKKTYYLLSVLLTLTIQATYCQELDSLTAYPMPNGYFYPKKQINNQLKLITEGFLWKKKFELEHFKNKSIDSLNLNLIELNSKKQTKISSLQIDSIQNLKHISMLNDFSKNTIIPFYEKELKKSKKNGIIIGFLSTFSVIFGVLYFSR